MRGEGNDDATWSRTRTVLIVVSPSLHSWTLVSLVAEKFEKRLRIQGLVS
jgi:hypothetical protein